MQIKLKRNADNTYTVLVDGKENTDFTIQRYGSKAEYDVFYKGEEVGCFTVQAYIKVVIAEMLTEGNGLEETVA